MFRGEKESPLINSFTFYNHAYTQQYFFCDASNLKDYANPLS